MGTSHAEGEALRRLIEQWRTRARQNGAIYASGIEECADELEAALAPLSLAPPLRPLQGVPATALDAVTDRVAPSGGDSGLAPLSGPVDASGEPHALIDKILDDWWNESPLGTVLVDGYREQLQTLMLKAVRAAAAAVPSSPAQEQGLPESLAASIALFREDPAAWWAEWQRKHDFKVKLITENEWLKALPPSSPVADSPTCTGPFSDAFDCPVHNPSAPSPSTGAAKDKDKD